MNTTSITFARTDKTVFVSVAKLFVKARQFPWNTSSARITDCLQHVKDTCKSIFGHNSSVEENAVNIIVKHKELYQTTRS
jgi:phosphohistidine phosphatase SixA